MDQTTLFPDLDPTTTAGPYRGTAPFVRGSATSRAAAESLTPKRLTGGRLAVLRCIVSAGDEGRTDQEIQHITFLGESTERPRRVELVEMGLVRDSGQTRPTTSKTMAAVWVATEQGKGSI